MERPNLNETVEAELPEDVFCMSSQINDVVDFNSPPPTKYKSRDSSSVKRKRSSSESITELSNAVRDIGNHGCRKEKIEQEIIIMQKDDKRKEEQHLLSCNSQLFNEWKSLTDSIKNLKVTLKDHTLSVDEKNDCQDDLMKLELWRSKIESKLYKD